MKKNIYVIVTLTALLSAVIGCIYAQMVKIKATDEILNTLWRLRRNWKQSVFFHPTKNDLKKLTRRGCSNIAAQIDNNSYSDDDYGNYSRECAIFILKNLAENMIEGENLAEYFARKNTDEEYYSQREDCSE